MVFTKARDNLREADLAFVERTLASTAKEAESLRYLLRDDPESRNMVLDCPALFEALADSRAVQVTSPRLWLYVFLRRALRRHGVDDAKLADYMTEVAVHFRQRHQSPDWSPSSMELFVRADDEPHIVFEKLVDTGDTVLFYCGVFIRELRNRIAKGQAEEVSHYERMGSQNYLRASQCPHAAEYRLDETLVLLGENFHSARLALNDLLSA